MCQKAYDEYKEQQKRLRQIRAETNALKEHI
jgi:hypothetical protein